MKTIHTPWGPSQHTENIAPGLTWVTTASHGGWLEEDCDSAAAPLIWPDLFKPSSVAAAVDHTKLNFHNGDIMAEFLASPKGEKARTIAAEFEATRTPEPTRRTIADYMHRDLAPGTVVTDSLGSYAFKGYAEEEQ